MVSAIGVFRVPTPPRLWPGAADTFILSFWGNWSSVQAVLGTVAMAVTPGHCSEAFLQDIVNTHDAWNCSSHILLSFSSRLSSKRQREPGRQW